MQGIYQAILDDKFFISLTNGFAKVLEAIGELASGMGGLKTLLPLLGTLMLRAFGDDMAKRKKVKKKAKRIATFGVLSIILVITICLTLFSVIIEIVDKYQEKNQLSTELIALQEQEKELETDVKKLEDPEYLARYAREKYFYSKDGELILRIPEE